MSHERPFAERRSRAAGSCCGFVLIGAAGLVGCSNGSESGIPASMKRVVVDHFGGPEVLGVMEEDDPRPGPGEVSARVLAAGVSFTDALLRAGTYLGVPRSPFTPGYELVGVVEELGPGCSRLREGDHVAALTGVGAPTRSASACRRRTGRGGVNAFVSGQHRSCRVGH